MRGMQVILKELIGHLKKLGADTVDDPEEIMTELAVKSEEYVGALEALGRDVREVQARRS